MELPCVNDTFLKMENKRLNLQVKAFHNGEAYRKLRQEWMRDFSLPHSNNLSERALRSVKSHCKVSGQFESVEYARYHARLKTYLETCRRNGFNEILALHRLAEGNPVSVEELFGGK